MHVPTCTMYEQKKDGDSCLQIEVEFLRCMYSRVMKNKWNENKINADYVWFMRP